MDDVHVSLPLARWPVLTELGASPRVSRPEGGTMNDTWLVGETSGGRACHVLRRHRFAARSLVEAEHAVMTAARGAGVPVPAVWPTDTGGAILGYEDRWWTLYAFAPGVQVPRPSLHDGHARAMGVALGELHLALAGVDPEVVPTPAPRRRPTAEELLNEISALRQLIADRAGAGVLTPEDRWADEELAGHARWIGEHGLPEPEPVPEQEIQVLHGDYQESNLFFDSAVRPTRITSVIDWDKAELGARGFEVVRCLKLSLGFDPDLSRAFLTGYRTVAELTGEQLKRSVGNEHARSLRGLWLPQMIYRHGEDRLRRFLAPGGFSTVAERWPAELD